MSARYEDEIQQLNDDKKLLLRHYKDSLENNKDVK